MYFRTKCLIVIFIIKVMEVILNMARDAIDSIRKAEQEAEILLTNGKNNNDRMLSEAELKCKEIRDQAIKSAKIERGNIINKVKGEILVFKEKSIEEYERICHNIMTKAKKKESEAIDLIIDIISI